MFQPFITSSLLILFMSSIALALTRLRTPPTFLTKPTYQSGKSSFRPCWFEKQDSCVDQVHLDSKFAQPSAFLMGEQWVCDPAVCLTVWWDADNPECCPALRGEGSARLAQLKIVAGHLHDQDGTETIADCRQGSRSYLLESIKACLGKESPGVLRLMLVRHPSECAVSCTPSSGCALHLHPHM